MLSFNVADQARLNFHLACSVGYHFELSNTQIYYQLSKPLSVQPISYLIGEPVEFSGISVTCPDVLGLQMLQLGMYVVPFARHLSQKSFQQHGDKKPPSRQGKVLAFEDTTVTTEKGPCKVQPSLSKTFLRLSPPFLANQLILQCFYFDRLFRCYLNPRT